MRLRSTLSVRLGLPLLLFAAWALIPDARSNTATETRWFKGNLHTHTVHSDGDSTPDEVARWYKEHHYQFLVLTDHNYFTDPAGLNTVFASPDRFLLIGGEEVTSRYEEKPIHVNGFGLSSTVEPVFGESVVETIQQNVDAIRDAKGLPSLNHPNFIWAVTPDELRQITGMKMFEVYNGHPSVHNEGGGGSPSLEEMWDIVLTAGREVYGVAVDDAHRFKAFGPEHSNPGRGWVQVRAAELSSRAILQALDAGDFYASTGVELADVSRGNGRLQIQIHQDGDFKYTTRFYGQGGKLLATAPSLEATYELRPGDAYVRATITDSMGRRAWVQPVFADR